MNAQMQESNAFPQINDGISLIKYLESGNRLKNVQYFHHYTSLEVAIKIIHNKMWHLCLAENMNDVLEFNSGDSEKWKTKLFSSFMGEDKESIAMWSMYGQPWEKGVKISIPKKVMTDWIMDTTQINEISLSNYNPTGRTIKVNENAMKIIAVAYSNCHDIENEGRHVLKWGTKTNDKVAISPDNFGELTGYIKNKAWEYEKELRIMFDQKHEYQRGAISVSDDVINSMILTPSPLFDKSHGSFEDQISKTITHLNIEKSIFTDKLNIRTICSDCLHFYEKKEKDVV